MRIEHAFHLRRGVSGFEAERPFDAAENVLLVLLRDFRRVLAVGNVRIVVPDVLAMAERRVEDVAASEFLAPRDWKEAGLILVVGMMAERAKVVNLRRVVVFE